MENVRRYTTSTAAVDQNQELPRRASQSRQLATSEIYATYCASKARALERYRAEFSAFPIFRPIAFREQTLGGVLLIRETV